jgi:hypothetical protein
MQGDNQTMNGDLKWKTYSLMEHHSN